MNNTAAQNETEIKHSLRFQVIVFVIVRLSYNTMYRMMYPFLSYFAQGMGVDLRAMSYAFTSRSLMGLIGPFFASVADQRGRRTGMVSGAMIFTGAISLIVIWPTFTTFFIGLSLSFIGYLIFVPSLQAYLGDKVPYENRGRVLGITEFSWSLSAIIGVPLVGFIIARKSWLAPFPLLALLGALSVIILTRMLPRDIVPQQGQTGFWKNLHQIFSYPTAIAALVMVAFYTAANEVITMVYGVWVEKSFNLNIALLSATALAIGFSELGGEVLVTMFTDRIGKRKALAVGILVNCLAVFLLLLLGRSFVGAMLSLFLFYLTFEFTLVSGIPLMTGVLPSARATMMAAHMAFIALGRSIGDLLAPVLYTQGPIPGIAANALAAIGFNLLAIFFLTRVRLPQQKPQ